MVDFSLSVKDAQIQEERMETILRARKNLHLKDLVVLEI